MRTIYQHDCERCVYLGPYYDENSKKSYDLYWCAQGGSHRAATVIARFSDKGPDYTSGMETANSGLCPPLAEAKHRAELLKLEVY